MMDSPLIAATTPIAAELVEGETYTWCRCGRSQNQPWCDGSHQGTDITPLTFVAEESGERFLCRCKQTDDAPFCDGSHQSVDPKDADRDAAIRSGDSAGSGRTPEAVPTAEEPTVAAIHALARATPQSLGEHGEVVAMGVPRSELPLWSDLQLLVAQLARPPLPDGSPVATRTVIGPGAARPLVLDIPIFVTDMSYGALSPETKEALARGAQRAGTGICSGEGGMLPQEQAANSRYLFEIGPGRFGWNATNAGMVQAVHVKAGQAAKTGVGGHLPAAKVTAQIAEVRGLTPGVDVVVPPVAPELASVDQLRELAAEVRELSGGVPFGIKLSANHLEADLAFALEAGVDYVIVDGRGGGTGGSPALIRDNISIPTIPAIARARRFLDRAGATSVTLVATGGIRMPADMVKALALGADAVALGNSSIQAAGCIGARICNTNNCPSGIATQDPALRARLDVEQAAARVERFYRNATSLMCVLARACGYDDLAKFNPSDLTSWKRDMADLAGVNWAGAGSEPSAR